MEDLPLAVGTLNRARADVVRNRSQLRSAALELLAEVGADKVTMDGLAARAGLGKGTVFRHFGTRAGIFRALLDDAERELQTAVLSGKPPLGPGAPARDRLIAYGHARIRFLFDNHTIARATLDGGQAVPVGTSPFSHVHVRMLVGQLAFAVTNLDIFTVQLIASLDGPLMLLLHSSELAVDSTREKLEQGWTEFVNLICSS